MTALLLTVGIGFFTAFHYQRDRDNMIAMTTNGAQILLATIENVIFNSRCTGNKERLHKTLLFISQNPSLLGIRIFNPESGKVGNSSILAEVGTQVATQTFELQQHGQTAVVIDRDGEELLSVIKPIRSRALCQECHAKEKKVLGVININYSMQETTEHLASSSQCFLLSMVFVTLLLSFGVAMILLRFVSKPIQVITRRMAQVEAGDLSVRMAPKHHDEMAYLMNSFNSMVENLAEAKKELEQIHFRQMEHADRLASIGEMSTGMAHEIKNPLAGISGAITVLADDFPPGDERRQIVHDVLAQIARLNKTASDLLKFGRPGEPQCAYLDINEVLKETMFFVAQHPEAKEVQQVLELMTDAAYVWADRKQIQQVLLNIIINALQAMPDGGTLVIQTELYNRSNGQQCIRIQIIDNGSGLPTERLDKIFAPFFTTKNQGTGLGLAICKQLVKQNSGHISVASKLGEGTIFTILLPVVDLPAEEDDGKN